MTVLHIFRPHILNYHESFKYVNFLLIFLLDSRTPPFKIEYKGEPVSTKTIVNGDNLRLSNISKWQRLLFEKLFTLILR